MKYKLVFLKLYCYLSDESDGDEIFIRMNGTKIWPVKDKYQTVREEVTHLNVEIDIQKGDILSMELWDHDKLSANDFLGKLEIKADAHGQFKNDFIKTGSDESRYALEWEIG